MLLLLSFTSQSQIDINKDSLICFPKSIVKEIQKDLIRKDLNDSITVVKDSMIVNRNQKINFKDSIIVARDNQISLYKNNEEKYKEQSKLKDEKIESLEDRIKKQRRTILGLILIEVIHTAKDLLTAFH